MAELFGHPLLRRSRRWRGCAPSVGSRPRGQGSCSARTAISTSSNRCPSCAGRCSRSADGSETPGCSPSRRRCSTCGSRSSRRSATPRRSAEYGASCAPLVRRRSARRQELAGVRLIDPTAVFPRQDLRRRADHGHARKQRHGHRPGQGDPRACRVRPSGGRGRPGLPVHQSRLDASLPTRRRRRRRLRRSRLARRDRRPRVRHPGRHGHRHRDQHADRWPAGHRRWQSRPGDRRRPGHVRDDRPSHAVRAVAATC